MSVELLDPKDVNCLYVVFVGHVDVGKSTATGNIAYHCAEKTPEFDKLMKGIGDKFEYRNFCDRSKTEQSRGITQSCHSNAIDLKIDGLGERHLVVCDSPGHQSFVKNLITGAADTDVAVLVVTASPSGLAAYMKASTLSDKRDATNETKGGHKLPSQMDQQLNLLRLFNIRTIIVMVNKMGGSTTGTDTDITPWSEAAFNEAKITVYEKMKKIGFNMSCVMFIPTDAMLGDNLLKPSTNMPWWKGVDFKPELPASSDYKPDPFTAMTLGEIIMKIKTPPRNYDADPRMIIVSTYKVPGVGVILGTHVVSGIFKTNDECWASPSLVPCKIKSLQAHKVERQACGTGSDIGVMLTGKDINKVGKNDTIGLISAPPLHGHVLIAKINWLGVQKVVNEKFSAIGDFGTIHVSVYIERILEMHKKAEKWTLTGTEPECLTWNPNEEVMELAGWKASKGAGAAPGKGASKSGAGEKKKPAWCPTSTNAYLNGLTAPLAADGSCSTLVRMVTSKNICCTTFKQCAPTGKLCLRNSKFVVGVAVVLQCEHIPIDPKLLPKKK